MMKFNLFCILLLCIHYVTASGPAFKFTDARRKLFPKKTSKRLMKGVVSTFPPLDEKTDSKEMPSCTGEVKARCDEGDVPVKLSVAPGYNDKYHSLTIGKVNNEGSCLTDFKINPPSSFNFDSVDEPDKSICVEARKGIPPLCKQYDLSLIHI